MTRSVKVWNVAVVLTALAAPCVAQQQPPAPVAVRALGPITNVSRDSLQSVAAAVEVGGGHVFVNDIIARRLLLLDSTLQSGTVVLDSSAGGTTGYGTFPGTLLPYHGDSALFISPTALSMLVLSPAGAIVRVMATPPSGGGLPALLGNIFGTPGFDARGRLAYFAPIRMTAIAPTPGGDLPRLEPPDSALIVRFDFSARRLDTVAAIRIPRTRTSMSRDDQGRFHVTMTAFPPRTVDDWAVTSSGAIAVVRGLDYHVEWLSSEGAWKSSPRVPYAWEHLNDEQKTALLDSTLRATQAMMDSLPARMQRAGVAGAQSSAPARSGAGGGGGGPVIVMAVPRGAPDAPDAPRVSAPSSVSIMPTATRAEPADVPDYRPAFGQGAVRADRGGNLWIRTSRWVDGRPVYDVVDSSGALADRVQLPPNRTVAGFGPGVIYMAVQDSAGVAHLERARIR